MSESERLVKELKGLLYETRAFLTDGPFTLSSGRLSNYYLDGKMLITHPRGNWLVGKLMFDLIRGLGLKAVGGLETGAIPIATAISAVSLAEAEEAPLPFFWVRKEARGHGTRKLIEGNLPDAGCKVAIVDDVVTTGESTLRAINAVKEARCEVAKVVVLLERHEERGKHFRDYDFASIFATDEKGNLEVTYPLLRSRIAV